MVNVTAVSRNYKQPYGGFLKPKDFKKEVVDDGKILNEEENIAPGLVGLAVEYLTKLEYGYEPSDIFSISLFGALLSRQEAKSQELLNHIKKGLDPLSIASACELVSFDTAVRAGLNTYRPVNHKDISEQTIENISILVQRALNFFNENGTIINIGTTFEGGYSQKIDSGDCDLLTADGLWDMKVSKQPINSKQTLQLLIYYVMGLRSIHKEQFTSLTRLGIFNPRNNTARYIHVNEIPIDLINTIEKDVIEYN